MFLGLVKVMALLYCDTFNQLYIRVSSDITVSSKQFIDHTQCNLNKLHLWLGDVASFTHHYCHSPLQHISALQHSSLGF